MGKISHKFTIEITKTTIVFGLVLLALGYFIGNTLPIAGGYKVPSGSTTITAGGQGTQQQAQTVVKLDVPSFVPFKGSDSAKIAVVEFGDYQCPFCERFFQQTEPQIIKEYIDTGKAKFYFLDFQFLGPDSVTLGEGAWCANEQGKYYQYHDYIYSNQGQENSGWATPDKLKSMVKGVDGLDVQKFGSCLDSKKYESRVQQLTQLGQSTGVSGTPTVLVGNFEKGFTPIVGAQPYSVFKQAIDQYLQ